MGLRAEEGINWHVAGNSHSIDDLPKKLASDFFVFTSIQRLNRNRERGRERMLTSKGK